MNNVNNCYSIWYTGRPVLILENNINLGVFNGDIGICIINGGKPVIYLENGKSFIPEVLPHHQLAYAMTIHKSQGSEYDSVYIILPNLDNSKQNILNRELLYTAVTRAKSTVTIYANLSSIKEAVENKCNRCTGLVHLLSQL